MARLIIHVPTLVPRATTWQQRVFSAFQQASPQPLSAADLMARLCLDRKSIYNAIFILKARGCISPVAEGKRCYVVNGDAEWPDDRRGRPGDADRRASWAAKGLHHGVVRQKR